MTNERQKPVNTNYLNNWDTIFGKKHDDKNPQRNETRADRAGIKRTETTSCTDDSKPK